MSQLDQKRHLGGRLAASGLPREADSLAARPDFALGPQGDMLNHATRGPCAARSGDFQPLDEWSDLMRSAISGDDAAYHRLLKSITSVLRAAARCGLARAGQPLDQSEDIVQDILLAVHLKRHTWHADAPFAPWLFAIARNKLISALRKRGRRVFVNIDDFAEMLADAPAAETASSGEVAAQLNSLPARQREVLQSIAVENASIRETAAKFSMSEGAVRVSLHRGLASLTAKLREQ
jgi:RNA polymerase sigma-70 factor, ECF subfamily